MSNTHLDENGDRISLKNEEFDAACAIAASDPDAKVYVHQKPAGSGKWNFCFSFLIGEYDELEVLEKIAEEFGAGEYPVQIKSKQEDGRPLILWQRNMNVVARRIRAQAATPPPSTAPTNDGLAIAIENQTRMLGAVLEKLSQPPPPTEPPKSTMDFAKELKVLKELFSDNDKKSMVETTKEALELVNLLKDTGAESDPLAKALDMFGPKIVEELDAQKTRPANAAKAAAQPQSERPAQAPPEQPTFAHIGVDTAYATFAENYLGQLLSIPGESSPEDIANFVVRRIGDDPMTVHIIGLVIEQDDMVERLAQFDARVMDRAHWLDSIADWLAHALWPDTNPAPDPENGTNETPAGEILESQVINGPTSDGAQEADSHDEIVEIPGEPGTRTSPGQLDNDP